MFCPNCGKDCQNFNFCPDCGRDLQEISEQNRQETTDEQSFEKRRKALENAGKLFCPKCLSANIVSKEADRPQKYFLLYKSALAYCAGGFAYRRAEKDYLEEQKRGPWNECLACGYKWYPRMAGIVKQYRPHLEALIGKNEYAVYTGEDGNKLTLEWNRLIIKYPEHLNLNHYVVWYWDLYCIKQHLLDKLTDEPEPRWITICDKKRKKWPCPGTPKLALKDPFTITYEKSQIEEFRKVKDALNGIIEENKKAGLL